LGAFLRNLGDAGHVEALRTGIENGTTPEVVGRVLFDNPDLARAAGVGDLRFELARLLVSRLELGDSQLNEIFRTPRNSSKVGELRDQIMAGALAHSTANALFSYPEVAVVAGVDDLAVPVAVNVFKHAPNFRDVLTRISDPSNTPELRSSIQSGSLSREAAFLLWQHPDIARAAGVDDLRPQIALNVLRLGVHVPAVKDYLRMVIRTSEPADGMATALKTEIDREIDRMVPPPHIPRDEDDLYVPLIEFADWGELRAKMELLETLEGTRAR
jgi:hypothetical protein